MYALFLLYLRARSTSITDIGILLQSIDLCVLESTSRERYKSLMYKSNEFKNNKSLKYCSEPKPVQ